MELDFCLAYLGEVKGTRKLLPLLCYRELPTCSIRIGEAIVAIAALEARIARIFSIFASPEEVLECLVKPSQDIL